MVSIKKERNISLDILRILAMFMIVLGHSIAHGKAGVNTNGLVSVIVALLNTLSTPATDVFVIISGYLLIKSTFRFKKLLLLWGQVAFYSVGIFLVMTLAGKQAFSVMGLLKMFLPVSFGNYWFFSVYIYMFMLSPFFNNLLNRMEQRVYRLFLGLGIILLVFTASIPGITVMNPQGGNGILWFLMLYATGGYLNRFPPKRSTGVYVAAFFALILIAFGSKYLLAWVSNRFGFAGMGESRLSTFDSFPIYFAAIALFSAFLTSNLDSKLKNNQFRKITEWCSVGTFGVYLIHEHNSIRIWLWGIFGLSDISSATVIPKMVAVSLLVFASCVLIDAVTWQQIKKIINHLKIPVFFSKVEDKLNNNNG